jgi:hypothetical protein
VVTPGHSLKVLGASVGSVEFMQDVCDQKVDKIVEHLVTGTDNGMYGTMQQGANIDHLSNDKDVSHHR